MRSYGVVLALCLAASGLAYLVNGLTITAYTHYIPTLMFIGAFFGFLLVLLRVEHAEIGAKVPARNSASIDSLQIQR